MAPQQNTNIRPGKSRKSWKTRSAPSRDQKNAPANADRTPISPKDLEDLEGLLAIHLGFFPRQFQLEAIKSLMLGKDTIVHAGTGMGKTVIALGPHLHPACKGRLTIMVSPLIALQNEQVRTFKKYGIEAVALNSSYGGCSPENLKKLKQGEFQILLISPELLLSRRFLDEVMKDTTFTSRIMSIVVDEAHVVSSWGAGFRKKYGELGMIRAFLPKATPVVAMSATLPARVRRDVLKKLEFPSDDYIFINIGNDRPNVSIVVRAIHNTMKSYSDLDFLVPKNVQEAKDIPLGMAYTDSVQECPEIADHLDDLCPPHLRGKGLVRPFSAAYSQEYREAVLELFKLGIVRILVCTDAAGMGCDLPAVEVVVQWKMPDSISTFVQRAGRAARSPHLTGLAVLLVEKSAYNVNLDEPPPAPKDATPGHAQGAQPTTTQANTEKRTKKEIQQYAMACGVNRGKHTGTSDQLPDERKQPRIDVDHSNEGLFALIQTTLCRRNVLLGVYENNHSDRVDPSVCCDLCNPKLLDRARPGNPPAKDRRKNVKRREEMTPMIWKRLEEWRVEIYERDWSFAMFSPAAILSDEEIELLATVEGVSTFEDLKTVTYQWSWQETYAQELWSVWEALVKDPEVAAISPQTEPSPPSSSTQSAPPIDIPSVPLPTEPPPPSSSTQATQLTDGQSTSRTGPPMIHPLADEGSESVLSAPAVVESSGKRKALEVDDAPGVAGVGQHEDCGQGRRKRGRVDQRMASNLASSFTTSFPTGAAASSNSYSNHNVHRPLDQPTPSQQRQPQAQFYQWQVPRRPDGPADPSRTASQPSTPTRGNPIYSNSWHHTGYYTPQPNAQATSSVRHQPVYAFDQQHKLHGPSVPPTPPMQPPTAPPYSHTTPGFQRSQRNQEPHRIVHQYPAEYPTINYDPRWIPATPAPIRTHENGHYPGGDSYLHTPIETPQRTTFDHLSYFQASSSHWHYSTPGPTSRTASHQPPFERPSYPQSGSSGWQYSTPHQLNLAHPSYPPAPSSDWQYETPRAPSRALQPQGSAQNTSQIEFIHDGRYYFDSTRNIHYNGTN